MHHTTPNPLGPTPRSKPTSKAASPLPLTALTDSGAYNNDGIGHSLVGAAWSIPTGLSASEEAIARKETPLLRRETHTLAKRAILGLVAASLPHDPDRRVGSGFAPASLKKDAHWF